MSVHTVTSEIDIDLPIRTVYNQWTQFEDFPAFMSGVERVDQIDDTNLRWTVRVAGAQREFTARIVEQRPDQLISWQSIDGPRHAGAVTFAQRSDAQTRLTLRLDWEPEGFVERAGAALQLDDAQVANDLTRFAELLESNGFETGAWRGTVDGPVIGNLPPNDAPR